MVDKAKRYFMGMESEFLNCAQAVQKSYMETYGTVDPQMVRSYGVYGGGMAPGGLCGALFAAKAVVEDPAKAGEVEKIFLEQVGSVKCFEIRSAGKVPCGRCVAIAAQTVEEITLAEQNVTVE